MRARSWIGRGGTGCLLFSCLGAAGWAQQEQQPQRMTSEQRHEAEQMLQYVADDVNEYYYDRQLHGIDWEARVREAKQEIEGSDSFNMALSHIAAALASLNDSHTSFIPPMRPYRLDYGFRTEMIGDKCFLTQVRPDSDAESKGLHAGDEVVAINGYQPTRGNLWKMKYVYEELRPQGSLRLNLRTASGMERQIDVMAMIRQFRTVIGIDDPSLRAYAQENPQHVRYAEQGKGLLMVKLGWFMPSPSDADSMVRKMQSYNAVILDLRGDPGGSVDTLQAVLGGMFENKVKIADRVSTGSTKAVETKSDHHPFTGKLAVLIDSDSASASELFARVIQLEKRGVVVGDESSGMVMESKVYGHEIGIMNMFSFGASVTVADLIMTDGQSLEHKGVVPDIVVLPTPLDLLNGRDPALAKAAELLGVQLSAEEAGNLFPYEWPKD
jgi:carboxyl-terminal processing protease